MLRAAFVLAAALAAADGHSVSAQAGAESAFVAVSDLSSGRSGASVLGISADGRVVVGVARSKAGEHAFRWQDQAMSDPGPLPGGSSASTAHGCSTDGSVIVGNSIVTRAGAGNPAQLSTVAVLWSNGAAAPLAGFSEDVVFSDAWGVSADGSVVAGQLRRGESNRAFLWRSGQVSELPALSDGAVPAAAYAVSADGTAVAGDAEGAGGLQAFRWSGGQVVGLGTLAPGPGASTARGISADGRVVVGQATSPWGDEAFRWENGTMVGLGGLSDDHEFFSMAHATSADGSIVVGTSESPAGGAAAFIWDRIHGMRSLQDVLVHELGLDLAGWSLTEATGVSVDGLTIIGSGRDALGQEVGWLARLGTPAKSTVESALAPNEPVFGTWTATIGGLSDPGGVCMNRDGTVFIADTGHDCVRAFSRDGREQDRWGHPGNLSAPHGVAWSPDGILFVADTGNDRVVAWSANGEAPRAWGRRGRGAGELNRPRGVAVNGSRLFVADTGNDRIVVFDLLKESTQSWGRLGDQPGEFRAPCGVAVADDGAIFVADSGNNRIQKLGSDGAVLAVFGQRGRSPGMFNDPQGIAVSGNQVFVADTGNHRIQVFDAAGAVRYAWGLRVMRPHEEAGRLHYPNAVAIASSGGGGQFAVVCESREDRCQVFEAVQRRQGEAIVPGYLPPPPSTEYFGTAMDMDGRVLAAANPDRGGVDLLDLSATPAQRIATIGDYGGRTAQMRNPTGVRIDRRTSQLIVADAGNHRIQFFDLAPGFDGHAHPDQPASGSTARLSVAIDLTRIRHSLPPDQLRLTIVPGPIECDASGNLYVLDQANNVVLVFDPRMTLVRVIGRHTIERESRLQEPIDMALRADGGRLYVVDRAARGIFAFDSDGGLASIWRPDEAGGAGGAGGGGGGGRDWTGPAGIAIGPDGIIYMTDDSNRVYKLDEQGRVLARWGVRGRPGIGPGEFFKPRAIAVDASGTVAVLDWGNHRVQMFSADGQFLGACGASMYVRPATVATSLK